MMNCSALYNVGRRAEAANYLRMAAAYDDSYTRFLQKCEEDMSTDGSDFVGNLINSRRASY